MVPARTPAMRRARRKRASDARAQPRLDVHSTLLLRRHSRERRTIHARRGFASRPVRGPRRIFDASRPASLRTGTRRKRCRRNGASGSLFAQMFDYRTCDFVTLPRARHPNVLCTPPACRRRIAGMQITNPALHRQRAARLPRIARGRWSATGRRSPRSRRWRSSTCCSTRCSARTSTSSCRRSRSRRCFSRHRYSPSYADASRRRAAVPSPRPREAALCAAAWMALIAVYFNSTPDVDRHQPVARILRYGDLRGVALCAADLARVRRRETAIAGPWRHAGWIDAGATSCTGRCDRVVARRRRVHGERGGASRLRQLVGADVAVRRAGRRRRLRAQCDPRRTRRRRRSCAGSQTLAAAALILRLVYIGGYFLMVADGSTMHCCATQSRPTEDAQPDRLAHLGGLKGA